jgi:hypothetical protein
MEKVAFPVIFLRPFLEISYSGSQVYDKVIHMYGKQLLLTYIIPFLLSSVDHSGRVV